MNVLINLKIIHIYISIKMMIMNKTKNMTFVKIGYHFMNFQQKKSILNNKHVMNIVTLLNNMVIFIIIKI